MALTVASLAGFPSANTAFQGSAGTPEDAATFTYTNGVFTQVGTQYVAGILDYPGVVPSRIFTSNNGTGGGGGAGTVPLPTLVSVTQVSAHGQSIQELPSRSTEASDIVGFGGFVIVLTPALPSQDSGGFPGQYPVNILGGYSGGLTSQNNMSITLTDVPGYTAQSPLTGYPQPQIRIFASMAALLILASTQYG